jgi:hypothetical protein
MLHKAEIEVNVNLSDNIDCLPQGAVYLAAYYTNQTSRHEECCLTLVHA